jgi:hypothetical protein
MTEITTAPQETQYRPPKNQKLNDKRIDFWERTFNTVEEGSKERHRIWRRLLNAYKLDFEVDIANPERISRFYPLARQIIASTSFNYPRMFFQVEDNNMAFQAEILERVANAAIELTNVKQHVQQATFDSLFCTLGWLKYGINPAGDDDLVPPYVANDAMQNGMVYTQRISPFNIFVDPICPPHDVSQARFIIERMIVPLEFVQKDRRFEKSLVNQIKMSDEAHDDGEEVLENIESESHGMGDEQAAYEESLRDGEFVVLYQVHNRIHKRQLTFVRHGGPKQPIQNIPHPFLAGQSGTIPDPQNPKRLLLNGQFRPTGGYLVEGGFPYHAIKFDLSCDSVYGLPMMAYAEDTQTGIIESLSRRKGFLKRFARMILGRRSEQQRNPDIGEKIETGEDAVIAWVDDVHNSFREMDMGNPPPDQLGYESDLRNYEDQILQVGQLVNAGQRTLTATQSALVASYSQLNREWLQQAPSGAYKATVHNYLRIMSDLRYTPKNFLVNVSEGNADPVYEAVTADMLRVRFKVHLEAGSMRPLYEELEKEDALGLAQWMVQFPEIDRTKVMRHVLRTFRVPDIDDWMGAAGKNPEIRAAQLENQWMAMRLEDPKVLPDQDHETHMATHQQVSQDPVVQQTLQQNPMQLQQFGQVIQQHIIQHQQFLQQMAQGQQAGGQGGTPGQINGLRREGGASPAGDVQDIVGGIDSAVRSSAQNLSQSTASINRNQN